MSTGQTMLAAAFFVLVTIAVMDANKMIIDSEEDTYASESYELAVNYANVLLNEIGTKKFDAVALDSTFQNTSTFTSPLLLGPEITEVISPLPDQAPFKSAAVYNDIDDYNNYQRKVSSSTLTGFTVSAKVYYISASYPDVKSTTQTYLKRIDVTVTNSNYLKNAISLSTVISY